MNREILFRGKRIDNGEWMIGYLARRPISIQDGNYSPWYIDVPPEYPNAEWDIGNVDYYTIGQYTGLNDKNGKKIFEGDILSISNIMDGIGTYYFPPIKYPYNVEVKWDMCAWMWKTLGKYEYYITFPGAWCHYECEIIGNIHDNPELLED